jgi:hypothetical protein
VSKQIHLNPKVSRIVYLSHSASEFYGIPRMWIVRAMRRKINGGIHNRAKRLTQSHGYRILNRTLQETMRPVPAVVRSDAHLAAWHPRP